MTFRPLFAIGAALALLAGCGTAHPGSAAVVDGREITLAQLDERTSVMCEALVGGVAADQPTDQPRPQYPRAEIRRLALTGMILQVLVAQELDERDIDIARADYELSAAERETFELALGDIAEDVIALNNEFSFTRHGASVLVADELGGVPVGQVPDVAINEYVDRLIDNADIILDPRFGMDELLNFAALSGSVSVLVDDSLDVSQGPGRSC